jgi:predicted RND superfamily exporter protein
VSFGGRVRASALSLVPVLCGTTWTLGACGWAGVPLDALSVAVSPLLVGIGIDDGLHALHGARYHGSTARSVLANGRAMCLTTLTTCVGFGGLVLTHVPTLRRGGAIVAVGTFLCLVVTLVLLPALAGDGDDRAPA